MTLPHHHSHSETHFAMHKQPEDPLACLDANEDPPSECASCTSSPRKSLEFLQGRSWNPMSKPQARTPMLQCTSESRCGIPCQRERDRTSAADMGLLHPANSAVPGSTSLPSLASYQDFRPHLQLRTDSTCMPMLPEDCTVKALFAADCEADDAAPWPYSTPCLMPTLTRASDADLEARPSVHACS